MNRETILRYAPTFIIAAALLVSAPRLASALAFVEPPFLGLPIAMVTGPAFGLTTAGATVYVWHVYQERKRLSLAKFLLVGWCILLGLIALVLVPGMVVEIRASPLADLLRPPLDIVWCIALAISSEIVVALAALASAIAEPKKREETKKSAEGKISKKPAKTHVAECSQCDWEGNGYKSERAARNAVNAHMRSHSKMQEEDSAPDSTARTWAR